ncbi:flagellar motor switch protein FliN [Lentisalinibacter sediminis]|uniref:flagellar motor switch protein FliN n=1 Tax=Lentisalinibacter sediminis TaxID=2992237 RepID=UPI00386F270D
MSDNTENTGAEAAEDQAAPPAADTGEQYSPDRFEKGASSLPADSADIKLDLVLDVPVTVSLRVGNTKISIRDLMRLVEGSVIELDRPAGEPMDVLVNGTLVAHGEIVVVNDKFGVRLTDVVSPSERIRKLN